MRHQMEAIIEAIRNGNMTMATNIFSREYGATFNNASQAVSAIAANLTDNQMFDGYVVTGMKPNSTNEFYEKYSDREAALRHAKQCCEEQYKHIRISGILAESKEKTITTIDL